MSQPFFTEVPDRIRFGGAENDDGLAFTRANRTIPETARIAGCSCRPRRYDVLEATATTV